MPRSLDNRVDWARLSLRTLCKPMRSATPSRDVANRGLSTRVGCAAANCCFAECILQELDAQGFPAASRYSRSTSDCRRKITECY